MGSDKNNLMETSILIKKRSRTRRRTLQIEESQVEQSSNCHSTRKDDGEGVDGRGPLNSRSRYLKGILDRP